MALEAGSVYAILGGRFSPTGFAQFDAAMKRSIATAGKTETSTAAATGAMARFGTVAKTGAAAGAVAMAVALGKSIGVAANFDQAMSDLQAVTKASAAEMKVMRNAALELGAKTGVGAKQAAGAMAELAKGGLSTKQTIGALAGTIAMSQAGSMDLATAATTVAQALNLFKLRGEDASHVADAFATAANKTTADIGFFAQGLAQGGAAAKAVGLTFDQTTAALETLAANGFKSGSDAGTSMKTMFTQLAKPTAQAQETAKKLGLNFFTAGGSMKSLTSISGMLRDKLGGLTRQQRLQAASTLVGQDGMRALLALYDQGPRKVEAFQRGLAAQGTASEIARQKMDNLKGATQRIGAQLETIGIKVGSKLMPYLKTAADEIVRFLDSLNKGDLTATGFGRGVQQIAAAALPLVDIFLGVARAAALMINVLAKNPLTRAYFAPLAESANLGVKSIENVKVGLKGLADMKPTAKVEVDANDAIGQLNAISKTKVRDKALRIVASDEDAKTKIRELIRLGIPEKRARVMVRGATEARAQIAAVRGELSQLQDKEVNVTYRERRIIEYNSSKIRQMSREADGRRPGKAETALVGEGGGPEYVGNQRKGFRRVEGATLMGLGADDYVIPTESRYRGRALALMADALGIPAFAPGRKARRKGGGKKKRYLPEKVYSAHSVDWYESRVNDLESAAGQKTKAGKATKRAVRAKKDLVEAKKQLEKAKSYRDRIEKLTTEADIQADEMRTADTNDDQTGYNRAYRKRRSSIVSARRLLLAALKLNPKANRWTQQIRAQLARLGVDLADMPKEPGSVLDEQQGPYTAAEQTRLDELDMLLAGAELTDTKDDDKLYAGQIREFLQGVYDTSGGRGAQSIAQIARDLKAARDRVTDLDKAPEPTADQQAQADQAYQRGLAAGQTSFIDRLTNATLQGSPTLVFQSYVPPSPTEARRLADYTVGGIGYQGARPSSSERIGA